MAGKPRNTASDLVQERYPLLGRLGGAGPGGREGFLSAFADGFVRNDHRPLVGPPSADAEGMYEGLLAFWELGAGSPSTTAPEIIAVRGDRSVLFRGRWEYEGGHRIEHLNATVYTADWKIAALEVFEVDDVDLAVAALDQLHEKYEAQPPTR